MKTTRPDRARRGAALLTTFAIIVLVAAVCSGMYAYSSHQVLASSRTRDFLKAKVIAEAGINQAYNVMKFNFAAKDDDSLFPETAFGGGSYDVEVVTVSSNTARLVSVGRCGLSQATVKVDLLNQVRTAADWLENGAMVDPALFTNYAILTGGMIDWGGGGTVQGGGKIRTNDELEMVGGGTLNGAGLVVLSSQNIYIQGSSKILGEAHAPSFEGKINNITTRVTEPVPFVVIPLLDLTPFYQRALANNEVKNGSFKLTSDYSPLGGVVWVNGNVKISNGSVNGCIVATGDIEISTSDSLSSVNGFPLLISRDGNIKITSTPELSGLVYARGGKIDWKGGGTLTGSIIAAGDLDKGGGSDLIIQFTPAVPSIPDAPDAATNSTDYVIISAWQD